MILDLNKVMYYSNGDGTLRDDNYKAKNDILVLLMEYMEDRVMDH